MVVYHDWDRLQANGARIPASVRESNPRKALKALRFINQYITDHGYSPTIREVAYGMNYESTATSNYWIEVLMLAGWVSREPKISRSIRVTPAGLSVLEREKAAV